MLPISLELCCMYAKCSVVFVNNAYNYTVESTLFVFLHMWRTDLRKGFRRRLILSHFLLRLCSLSLMYIVRVRYKVVVCAVLLFHYSAVEQRYMFASWATAATTTPERTHASTGRQFIPGPSPSAHPHCAPFPSAGGCPSLPHPARVTLHPPPPQCAPTHLFYSTIYNILQDF